MKNSFLKVASFLIVFGFVTLTWLGFSVDILASKSPHNPIHSKHRISEVPNTHLNKLALQQITGLEGIYIHQGYSYGLGIQVVYRPYMLFTNGSLYKNLDTNPLTFSPDNSKKQEADMWGTWKKNGNEISVVWNNGKTEIWKDKTWFKTVAPKSNEVLSGSYRSISGVSNISLGGDANVLSVKEVSFQGNKFSYKSTLGSSNSGMVSYSGLTDAGTYRFEDNTIVLTFNNAVIEKKFFFFAPDSKRVFCIGTTYYIEQK